MVQMSVPRWSRWVAKLCLNVWALNTLDKAAFRIDRVVMQPEHIAHLIQKLRGLRLTFHFGLLFFRG